MVVMDALMSPPRGRDSMATCTPIWLSLQLIRRQPIQFEDLCAGAF